VGHGKLKSNAGTSSMKPKKALTRFGTALTVAAFALAVVSCAPTVRVKFSPDCIISRSAPVLSKDAVAEINESDLSKETAEEINASDDFAQKHNKNREKYCQ